MSASLRISLLVFSLVFLCAVVRLVVRHRLQLKYSLLWMALALVLLLCAIFPEIVGVASHLFGVEYSSNFVFLTGLVGLLGISLSLTVIASWQAHDIRQLIQRVALLEHELELRRRELSDCDRADENQD